MSAANLFKYIIFIGVVLCMIFSAGHAFSAEHGFDLNKIKVLDLESAKRIALADNPTLAAAGDRLKQASERVKQAGSAYWPRLDAAGSGSRVVLSENSYQTSLANARRADPFAEIDDRETYYNAGLTLSWTLFNGFERKFSNMSAQYGEQESLDAVKDAQRLLLSSVSGSYYHAQRARENIFIAEANRAFNERQLKEAEARYRIGTGSYSDVLNFEIQINSANAELIIYEQSYDLAESGLAVLMGVPGAVLPLELELASLENKSIDDFSIPDMELLEEYAMAHRPDLRQVENLLKQSDANVGTARAGFYPSINLSASYDGDRTGTLGFEQDDFGKIARISLSYNLFAGGYNKAKVNEALARQREIQRSIDSKKISIKSDIVSAVTDLKSALDQYELQVSNVELVRKSRDLVEKEYAAGQGSLVRLNEAQRDLITAQSRLVYADVSLRLAWENLKASTGEILEPGK